VSEPGLSIAPIRPAEIPILLQLIRELAQFERLEHELQGTLESFQECLFGAHPAAGALLARVEGQPAGYALYFFTFCSFAGRQGLWLDDLYVRPQYRHRGVGRSLIQAVAGVGAQRNCARFEWIALNWNRNALEFYRSLGARVLDEWTLLRLDSAGLRNLATSPHPPAGAAS